MEQRFEFEGAEVQPLVEEAFAASERLMTEAQRLIAAGVDIHGEGGAWDEEVDHPGTGAAPGLWLRNDRGVYLQSNASRRPGERVAHARGYRGEVQVGDETFCEFIDAAPLRQVRPGDTLVVLLTGTKIRLSLIREA